MERTAPDFAAGAAAVERERARVETRRHDCDDCGSAAEFVGVDAAGPHHRDDGERAFGVATHPVVQQQDADEPQYDRELQSRGGRFARLERAGPEEKVKCFLLRAVGGGGAKFWGHRCGCSNISLSLSLPLSSSASASTSITPPPVMFSRS